MKDFFYTPEYAKTGDVIPFYNEETGRFEGYYLKNWNPDAPKEMVKHGWHHIISEDNRTFSEQATNIQGGTGSVIKVDDIYHMFYCTFDFDPQAQWVRHATSTDLVNWTDYPEEKFGPDGNIYRMSDWRDPFVFWNPEEEKWWMLLAARENTNHERNGCTALCTSQDLVHWDYEKPVYSPHIYESANECPDLLQIGDWYYLIYSNYTDGFSTYYCMSKSLKGPWISPASDTFDSRAFYAAKTVRMKDEYFIYGWNPSKGENSWKFDPGEDFGIDYKSWNWGGSIVVHKLIQHEDGTLGVRPVDALLSCKNRMKEASFTPIEGEWDLKADKKEVYCEAPVDFASILSDIEIPRQCRIESTLKYSGAPNRFGIALQMDAKFAFGYYLMFEPKFNRVEFRSGLRMYEQGGQMFPYASEMERFYKLGEEGELKLDIFIQDSIAVMYINNDFAFGFRMYDYSNRKVGFFAERGNLSVKNVYLSTEV